MKPPHLLAVRLMEGGVSRELSTERGARPQCPCRHLSSAVRRQKERRALSVLHGSVTGVQLLSVTGEGQKMYVVKENSIFAFMIGLLTFTFVQITKH